MSRIDELIAHHRHRMAQAADEIARIEKLPEGRFTTYKDYDHWIKGWEHDRRISLDTGHYLEVMKERGVAR